MDNNNYLTLVTNWQTNHCLESRNMVVMGVVALVQSVVKKFKSRNSQEDLFNEGIIGVMQACDTYDSTKGSFLTYAKNCARFNIMDYVRHDSVIPRGSRSMHSHNLSYSPVPESHSEIVNLALKKGLSYSTVQKYAMSGGVDSDFQHEVEGRDTTLLEAELLEQCEQLTERLERLKPRHYAILNRHFVQEETYSTIAEEFGVSDKRIGQIIKYAVDRLRI